METTDLSVAKKAVEAWGNEMALLPLVIIFENLKQLHNETDPLEKLYHLP